MGYKPRPSKTALYSPMCYNIHSDKKLPLGSRHVETATVRAGVEKNQRAMVVNINPSQRKK